MANMTIREQTEALEKEYLSPLATLSCNSKGRDKELKPCIIRTDFARDRDRIIHSKSFRRLKHKTQVFFSPKGDHYRTRLTHTLEVSQIARTIARALRLNEDLTEAIALGHDLGHTPFGHTGEFALDNLAINGFQHSSQSVRVVECIERDGAGLNLTWEVRNGIACHSKGTDAATLEGRVVRFADKIAYLNHDMEDAIRAGVISEMEIPYDVKAVAGLSRSERLTSFIMSIIENSKDDIVMSKEMQESFDVLKAFMFETVYKSEIAKLEEPKAIHIVNELFKYFTLNSDKMSSEYKLLRDEWGVERAVIDYVSGMSDRYAIEVFNELFVPKGWSIY